jgi:hypothetical protein
LLENDAWKKQTRCKTGEIKFNINTLGLQKLVC